MLCLVDRDIDYPLETIRNKIVRSKRIVKCVECERNIPSGVQFLLEIGQLDGDYTCNITCLSCKELRDRFCCTWYYGSVLDDIQSELGENGGELALGCLDGLGSDARDFICETLEDIYGILDYSYNPLAMRCTPCSPACANCWRLTMAKRLAANKWERLRNR